MDASPWSLSGFGSITAGQLDTDKANFRGYTDELSLKPDSLFGLQISYQFNDKLSAVVQGTLKEKNKNYFDYNDDILNWAYLTWFINDNVTLKAGRMRAPFLAFSDINDIGYAYPWITLPKQAYSGWLFPTYDGIDLSWNNNFNDVDTSLESYIGTYQYKRNVNASSSNYRVNALGGLIGKVNYNNFQFRLSQHQGEVDMDVQQQLAMAQSYLNALISGGSLSVAEAQQISSIANSLNDSEFSSKGTFRLSQASIFYDNLHYFSRAEWARIETNELDFAPNIESYYVTAGYTAFPWTFSLTYSESKVTYNDKIEMYRNVEALSPLTSYFNNDSVKIWTIGTRWDIQPKIALKAEVSLINGYPDKDSYFTEIEEGFNRNAVLYKLSMQWVF